MVRTEILGEIPLHDVVRNCRRITQSTFAESDGELTSAISKQ